MKDQVQSCHLTKFNAFGVNRDEVIDLETWFKIHANVCNLETDRKSTRLNSSHANISYAVFCLKKKTNTKKKKKYNRNIGNNT